MYEEVNFIFLIYVEKDRLAAAEYSRAAELAVNVEGYGVEKADHYYQCSAQIYLDSGGYIFMTLFGYGIFSELSNYL